MAVSARKNGACDDYEVPSARLDDIVFASKDKTTACSNLVALKIDVEGHEVEVFRGGGRVLRRCRPRHIFIEGGARAPAVVLLKSYGYRVRGHFDRGHDTHLSLQNTSDPV